MGLFKTSKRLNAEPSMIPQISKAIEAKFQEEGYEVTSQELIQGGREISITKGGLFKAIVGLKTALKIKLTPVWNQIDFNAGIGIWGMQIIPAAVGLFVTWPVLLTQIWGLVQQSKLDDQALEIAEHEISKHVESLFMLCPFDGQKIPAGSEFCPYCGKKIQGGVL